MSCVTAPTGSRNFRDKLGWLAVQRALAFGGPLEGGRIALEADARPFAQTKTFLLRRASLERVDLGSFLGRSDLAGPVTLRATGSGRVRGNSRSVKGRRHG